MSLPPLVEPAAQDHHWSTAFRANQRAADTGAATTGVDVANANTLACGSLLVMTGTTAGNLQIRFASEVAGSNAVVKAGSNLVATKVA